MPGAAEMCNNCSAGRTTATFAQSLRLLPELRPWATPGNTGRWCSMVQQRFHQLAPIPNVTDSKNMYNRHMHMTLYIYYYIHIWTWLYDYIEKHRHICEQNALGSIGDVSGLYRQRFGPLAQHLASFAKGACSGLSVDDQKAYCQDIHIINWRSN